MPVPVPVPKQCPCLCLTNVLVGCRWIGVDVSRPLAALAPLLPCYFAFHLERACVQTRFPERQELVPMAPSNVASAQPVPAPLPTTFVLVGCVWIRGNIGRPFAALAPCLPPSLAFQLDGACTHQRLLERDELLVLWCTCASTQPVTVPLPPVMRVYMSQQSPRHCFLVACSLACASRRCCSSSALQRRSCSNSATCATRAVASAFCLET